MYLDDKNMEKYEQALMVFKGTCELNNYRGVKLSMFDDDGKITEKPIKQLIETYQDTETKSYFYISVYDKKEKLKFGAFRCGEMNVYTDGEMINLAVKYLFNLEEYEATVLLKGKGNHKELIENLETLDIDVEETLNLELTEYDEDLGFDVLCNGNIVMHGGSNYKKNYCYLIVDYESLEENFHFRSDIYKIDAYIQPFSKEVINDAFIIGSNLKDSGFTVEIDYNLEKVKEDSLGATFLITMDEENIKNYEVIIKDLATKESHKVKIDNLVEELSFM